jgi:putative membrane protein
VTRDASEVAMDESPMARVTTSRDAPSTHEARMTSEHEQSGAAMPFDVSEELSKRRTGLSFQRTRMSADRTLMSVIRTSLSLISFGFTIFNVLGELHSTHLTRNGAHSPRNFSLALIALGVGALVCGIAYHLFFMRGLRHQRTSMVEQGLVHGESTFPISFIVIIATCLLLIGLMAIASIGFGVGPFE